MAVRPGYRERKKKRNAGELLFYRRLLRVKWTEKRTNEIKLLWRIVSKAKVALKDKTEVAKLLVSCKKEYQNRSDVNSAP